MTNAATPAPDHASHPPAATAAEAGEITVVFDGDCPVCTAYSCNINFDGPNKIVDARKGGALVDDLTKQGFDLDEGMVVIHQGKTYHGADAVQMMALHSRSDGLLGRLNHIIFRSSARSRALYPILRFGRNTLLRILGRKKINNSPRR